MMAARHYRQMEIRSPRSTARRVAKTIDVVLFGPKHEREVDWALGALLAMIAAVIGFATLPYIVKALGL